jgi:hypothetical protein
MIERGRWQWSRDGGATRIESSGIAALTAIRQTRHTGTGARHLPSMRDVRVLFIAADHLPDEVGSAGSGSVLVAATSGQRHANRDAMDLVTCL